MISTALSILVFTALVATQSSTVSLFLPQADPQSLVGSIAGSDSTATTYVVACASPAASTTAAAASASASASATGLDNSFGTGSSDDSNCGFPSPFTVVQGPKTVHYTFTVEDAGVETLNCQLMGTTQAICTAAASGSITSGSDAIPPLTTVTLGSTDMPYMPVIITAGSANAKQTGSSGAAARTTGASVTGGSTSTTAGRTGSKTFSGGSTAATGSSARAQSTNAAVQGISAFGKGVMGALGVAVAGAML